MNLKGTLLFLLSSAFMLLLVGCSGESQVADTPTPEAKVVAKVEVEPSPTKETPKPEPTNTPIPKPSPTEARPTVTAKAAEVTLTEVLSTPTPVATATQVPPTATAPIPTPTEVPPTPTPTKQAVKLENLLIENLGTYDSASATFGKLKYDVRFGEKVFDEFGKKLYGPHGNIVYNPTFKFKAPADTVLIAPISGFISYVEWQPSGSEGDWEIHISQDIGQKSVRIGIDHIDSIECDRLTAPVSPCHLPLKIGDSVVAEYMPIKAGEVIGYVGYWSGYESIGINGMTELMVFKYTNGYEGVMNYCPTMHLDEAVEEHFLGIVQELMTSFEEWSGEYSAYDEQNMVSPGCLYSATKELNGEIELIKEIQ